MNNMAQAPVTINFEGKDYTFYPLRDCDFCEFEVWAQDRYLSVAKRNVKDLPETQATMILSNAFDRAALMTFSSKECAVLMKTIEGSSLLCHLALRKAIPIEEVKELCRNEDFLAVALTKINALSGAKEGKNLEVKKKQRHPVGKKSIKRSAQNMAGRQKKSVK